MVPLASIRHLTRQGADEGTLGMREGGWRRLIVPNAYGDAGFKKFNRAPGCGRYVGLKAPYAVRPNAPAYFE